MMRAMAAGVQGMRAHQTRMDVIGNNIANVNTTAFKASRVMFAEMYNQTMQGATSPGAARGGVNPKQVGLGVGVAAIETIQEPGNLQATGKATDLALSGNGFFVMRDGGRYVYTRAGNFDFDSDGFLVNPATGQRVQGWLPAKTTGVFPPRDISQMTDIQLPVADAVLASPTTSITFDQSLNADATDYVVPAGTMDSGTPTHSAALTVIDSLGKEHTITLKFFKRQANVWDVMAYNASGAALNLSQPYTGAAPVLGPTAVAGGAIALAGPPAVTASRIEFNADGSLKDPDGNANTPFTIDITNFVPGGGANGPMTVKMDFTKVIQPNMKGTTGTSTLRMLDYNGYPTGALDRIYVDNKGVVTGYYTNGQYREVAQVAVANFFNPAGLLKDANNNWIESPNSGWALIGAAGESGRGVIASNNLEMSNVDISQEFTNMIITQRGFQANSRIITTSDEMLQEVVNLKR
ncbi:MAG TPA: flagellar hook protein FlgE [Symbiobacteriaceae bacterium]|nr:flagellar hook protein FlgE [Symbiobacteriaceae bacterium]